MTKQMLALMMTAALSLPAVMLPSGALAEADGGSRTYSGYVSLDTDPAEAIAFDGETVTWNGKTFPLNENTIFLDYRLEDAQIADNPYAFNDVHQAFEALTDGTPDAPMLLLTAPGVYWVDHPDDPEIRTADNGPSYQGTPIAVDLDVDDLYFYGLSSDYHNVVFAGSRGNTQGAEGFFTLFHIDGERLRCENVTFGNYCNVDLEFPLDPSLSRPKRANSITQAQLFNYTHMGTIDFGGGPMPWPVNNDDGVAVNSAFVSRLNLLPFARTFIGCHVESSGHASFYKGVYIDTELDWYGQNFTGGGYFLNCDINICSNVADLKNTFNFSIMDGSGSGLAAIDTRFHRQGELLANDVPVEIYWDKMPGAATTRSYQYNVTMDGNPYVIQSALSGTTIELAEDSDLLKAYRVSYDGNIYYNLPNLLPGVDPQGELTEAITLAGSGNGYLSIPYTAVLSTSHAVIRSGQQDAVLTYGAAPEEYADSAALGAWSVEALTPEMAEYVNITLNEDGRTAVLAGTNNTEEAKKVMIVARNELGIEAAIEMTIEPSYVDAPPFLSGPELTGPADGRLELTYQLDLGEESRVDQSLITWYRCGDAEGSDPVKVSESRLNDPERQYTLAEGDIGSWIMASIEPKHNRCDPGEKVTMIFSREITEDDVTVHMIDTNFQNFPVEPQPEVIAGRWTLKGYRPLECVAANGDPLYVPQEDSWFFGEGGAGSTGYFGLDEQRGAFLMYTPIGDSFGNMKTVLTCAPDKNAGQGFRDSTHNFMDLYIKFDAASMTGYALRLERLSNERIIELGYPEDKANGVAGVAFSLVEYKNEAVTYLTEQQMTSSFLTECTITLEAKDGVLTAGITSTSDGARGGDGCGYARDLTISAPYAENGFGSTGLVFTGDVFPGGTNSVILYGWNTVWGE